MTRPILQSPPQAASPFAGARQRRSGVRGFIMGVRAACLLVVGLMPLKSGACGLSFSGGYHPFPNIAPSGMLDATITLGHEGEPIPVMANFSSDPALRGGPIGGGWRLPLFQSIATIVDDKTIECVLPDGETLKFKKRDDGAYMGSNWLMQVNKKVMACQSPCGYALVFTQGRLSEIRTPAADVYKYVYRQNEITLTKNGTIYAVLNIVEYVHPSGPLKSSCYGVKMGQNNASIKCTTESGFTTATITRDNLPNISTGKSFLKLADRTYTCDASSGVIQSENDWSYAFESITGIKCLVRKGAAGTEVRDVGHSGSNDVVTIRKDATGPLHKVVMFPLRRTNQIGTIKKLSLWDSDGNERILEENFIDETGAIIRSRNRRNDADITYDYEDEKTTAVDSLTGEILWARHYDKDGCCILFENKNCTIRLIDLSKNLVSIYFKGTESRPIEKQINGAAFLVLFPKKIKHLPKND